MSLIEDTGLPRVTVREFFQAAVPGYQPGRQPLLDDVIVRIVRDTTEASTWFVESQRDGTAVLHVHDAETEARARIVMEAL